MVSDVEFLPMPHVRLVLRVPVPLLTGGWTWGQSQPLPEELAREYAYSDDEVRALVLTYGRMVPVLAPLKVLGDRFRVTAWGVSTGLCVGLQEWGWSSDAHAFRPVGEYLSGWREAVRVFYRRTGEVFGERRFHAHGDLRTSGHRVRLRALALPHAA